MDSEGQSTPAQAAAESAPRAIDTESAPRAIDAEPAPRAIDAGQASADPAPAPALPRTRLSATYKAFIAGAVIVLLLLIFILENTESVKVSYLGLTGHLALGVALLLGAVGGALLVGVVGAARIGQLRVQSRRRRR